MAVRKSTAPDIEDWDERSGQWKTHPETAFGFVYFKDGTRVAFSIGNPEGDVFQPGEQFRIVPHDQLMAAAAFLRKMLKTEVRDPR